MNIRLLYFFHLIQYELQEEMIIDPQQIDIELGLIIKITSYMNYRRATRRGS